jgi:phage shock protein PspC (stress-responsive transcriptional regulator)
MSEHTLHTPSIKRLERSRSNKVIAGVCGGLGRYFDLSPTVFRLGLVVLTLLGGAGILVYLAAVLVIPAEGTDASIAEDVLARRQEHPGRLVALALVAVALFVLLSRAGSGPSSGAAWFLVLVGGLVVLVAGKERRAHRILIAVVTLVVTLFVAAIIAVVAAFASFDVSLNDGVGDRLYAPTSIAQIDHTYKLGIGDMKVDLSQLPTSADAHVRARLGIGELRVTVPRDASVVVTSHVKAGDVHALDPAARTGTSGGTLYLDARVGAGRIDVVRAP